MSELTDLRNELIAARMIIDKFTPMSTHVSINVHEAINAFNKEYPCQHLSVTEYLRIKYAETRDQPAEWDGHAICNECGERLDTDDVLSYAERIEGNAENL